MISELMVVDPFSDSWIFAFSIVARRAAGESTFSVPPYGKEDNDGDEGKEETAAADDDDEEEPVRRCTNAIKSLALV